jgi:hypothetical protein
MWSGTPRRVAEKLIAVLPVQPSSRAFYDLERRLLLSPAQSPEGAAGETKLVVLRAEKLIAMGALADAQRLLHALPQRELDERLSKLRLDAAWLAGDLAGACADTRQNLAKSRAELWQRAQAFCLALDGDKEKADLAMRLLPEQRFPDDPAFNALMDANLGNERVKLPPMPQPRPLDLAMLTAAHRPVPPEIASNRDPRTLAALAAGGNAEPAQRLAAAERLESAGAWRRADLAKLYASLELPADALANPLPAADADRTAKGRAILWQAARKLDSAQARLPMIEKALTLAPSAAAFDQQARLYANDMAQLQPSVELLSSAPTIARGLEAGGRPDDARRWLKLLEAEAPRSPEAGRQFDSLWVLSVLGQADAVAWSTERFQAWRRSLKGTDQEQDAKLGLALILIDAAGHPVPSDVWRDLVSQSARRPTALPPATLLPALAAAGEERRTAEAVSLAAITLGETQLADQPALILGVLVQRLRALDLAQEARGFALEAALAAGL